MKIRLLCIMEGVNLRGLPEYDKRRQIKSLDGRFRLGVAVAEGAAFLRSAPVSKLRGIKPHACEVYVRFRGGFGQRGSYRLVATIQRGYAMDQMMEAPR